MRITAARFLGAAGPSGGAPPPGPPEIAIGGRSNVGKSSLINCLVGRRGLARASQTPGRTRPAADQPAFAPLVALSCAMPLFAARIWLM